MFWFKNAIIYRLTKTLDWSTDKLQEALQGCKYIPCDKSEMSRFGWTSPIINSELLYHAAENEIVFSCSGRMRKKNGEFGNRILSKRVVLEV
ncbi:recombination-associated protein RdgC [Pasteurella multocida]